MAYKTGIQYPRVAGQVAPGTDWLAVENLINNTGSATLASNVPSSGYTPVESVLQLIVDGALAGTNRAGTAISKNGDPTYWGVPSLTVAQLKSESFGFRHKFSEPNAKAIDVTGFDFSIIPDNATITDILISYGRQVSPIGGGDAKFSVSAFHINITFDYPAVLAASGSNEGMLYAENPRPHRMETKLRYLAYDSQRNFLGEHRTVASNPSIKTAINTLHSQMEMVMGQNDLTTESEMREMLTEGGDQIVTESEAVWLAELTTAVGVGEDTNIDTNIEVDVIAAYGEWLPWLTEAGDPIITEDNRLIVVADGHPDGRKIYGGYISNWELEVGGSESVSPNLLSHSQELNNIMLQTSDTRTGHAYVPVIDGYVGMRSQLQGATTELAQTITITGGTKKLTGVSMNIANRYDRGEDYVGVTIRTGTTPDAGTIVATGSIQLPYKDGNLREEYIPFDAVVQLTDGQQYIMQITTNATYRTTDNLGYPIQIGCRVTGTYSGGTGMDKLHPNNTWRTGGWDIAFQFWEQGGATTVNFFSVDPSFALKEVLRYAQKQGSRVKFTDQTIEMTHTVVTLRLNTNTIDEAIQAILKSMPADWCVWYDPATDEVHAHPRPTTVTRRFIRGRDVTGTIKIKKSIEKLVNDVYYSGGDLGGGTNLFIRETDSESINNVRRGILKISDSRVKDATMARVLARGEIDTWKNPVYSATATIVRTDAYSLEDVQIGELDAFGNFGHVVDSIEMQIVAMTYNVETIDLELNVMRPRISKRIEDIRRNLALQEMENNPTSPS